MEAKKNNVRKKQWKPCCTFMLDITKRLPWGEGYSRAIPIKYSPRRRLYLLQPCPAYRHIGGYAEDKVLLTGIPMSYCIFCGTKLPRNLAAAWLRAIRKECKIDLIHEPHAPIPRAFRSESWWKKRGL